MTRAATTRAARPRAKDPTARWRWRGLAALTLLASLPACYERLANAVTAAPPDAGPVPPLSAVSAGGSVACAAGVRALYTRPSGGSRWQALVPSAADALALQDLRLFALRCTSETSLVAVGSTDTSPPSPRVVVARWDAAPTLSFFTPEPVGDLFGLALEPTGALLAVGYRVPGADAGATTAASLGLSGSADLGAAWTAAPALSGFPPLRAVWIRGDGERVAVGDSGILLHAPGVATPYASEQNPQGAVTMRGVWAPDSGRFLAVGDSGSLLQRSPMGQWSVLPTERTFSTAWRSLHGTREGNVFAVGGSTIAHFDGSLWREVVAITGLPAARDLSAVWTERTDPIRVHLAGDHLLFTCTASGDVPPTLACAP